MTKKELLKISNDDLQSQDNPIRLWFMPKGSKSNPNFIKYGYLSFDKIPVCQPPLNLTELKNETDFVNALRPVNPNVSIIEAREVLRWCHKIQPKDFVLYYDEESDRVSFGVVVSEMEQCLPHVKDAQNVYPVMWLNSRYKVDGFKQHGLNIRGQLQAFLHCQAVTLVVRLAVLLLSLNCGQWDKPPLSVLVPYFKASIVSSISQESYEDWLCGYDHLNLDLRENYREFVHTNFGYPFFFQDEQANKAKAANNQTSIFLPQCSQYVSFGSLSKLLSQLEQPTYCPPSTADMLLGLELTLQPTDHEGSKAGSAQVSTVSHAANHTLFSNSANAANVACDADQVKGNKVSVREAQGTIEGVGIGSGSEAGRSTDLERTTQEPAQGLSSLDYESRNITHPNFNLACLGFRSLHHAQLKARSHNKPANGHISAFIKQGVRFNLAMDRMVTERLAKTFVGEDFIKLIVELLALKGFSLEAVEHNEYGAMLYAKELHRPVKSWFDLEQVRGAKQRSLLCLQIYEQPTPLSSKVFDFIRGKAFKVNAELAVLATWQEIPKQLASTCFIEFLKLSLWDAAKLKQCFCSSYNQLSPELRNKVPIKKVWLLSRG